MKGNRSWCVTERDSPLLIIALTRRQYCALGVNLESSTVLVVRVGNPCARNRANERPHITSKQLSQDVGNMLRGMRRYRDVMNHGDSF